MAGILSKLTNLTVAGTTLVQALASSFSAAAQPVPGADGTTNFMGIPYTEINAGDIKPEGKPLREVFLDAVKKMRTDNPARIEKNLTKIDEGIFFNGAWAIPPKGGKGKVTIESFEPDHDHDHEHPRGGIIIMESVDTIRNDYKGIRAPKILRQPGMAEFIDDFLRGHEKAHMLGSNEQIADQIGAILYLQKNPQNRGYIEVWRDYRQLQTMTLDFDFAREYGQASVDALSDVLAMPQAEIDAIKTKQDFQNFILNNRFNLSLEDVEAYNSKDMAALVSVTRGVWDKNNPNVAEAVANAREGIDKIIPKGVLDMKNFDVLQSRITRLYAGDYNITPKSNAAIQKPGLPANIPGLKN